MQVKPLHSSSVLLAFHRGGSRRRHRSSSRNTATRNIFAAGKWRAVPPSQIRTAAQNFRYAGTFVSLNLQCKQGFFRRTPAGSIVCLVTSSQLIALPTRLMRFSLPPRCSSTKNLAMLLCGSCSRILRFSVFARGSKGGLGRRAAISPLAFHCRRYSDAILRSLCEGCPQDRPANTRHP